MICEKDLPRSCIHGTESIFKRKKIDKKTLYISVILKFHSFRANSSDFPIHILKNRDKRSFWYQHIEIWVCLTISVATLTFGFWRFLVFWAEITDFNGVNGKIDSIWDTNYIILVWGVLLWYFGSIRFDKTRFGSIYSFLFKSANIQEVAIPL